MVDTSEFLYGTYMHIMHINPQFMAMEDMPDITNVTCDD